MTGRPTPRFTPSFVLGLLAVPLSALAAFVLVTGLGEPAPAEAVDTTLAVSTTTSTTTSTHAPELEYDAAADLALACGEDGMALVTKEVEGTISPVEQAALDALRPVCEAAGMPLPGPPAPPPVVRTVRVTTNGGGSDGGGAGADDDGGDEEDEDDRSRGSAADYEAARHTAQAAIAEAVAGGGNPEKIAEARKKLDEAERKAARGDYGEAEKKAREAEKKAREALGDDD